MTERDHKSTQRRVPRSRFKPQAQAGLRLEERDEQLLCDLLLHRAMSREQIQQLHFTSVVRCNARLRQLFDHRFVLRHYPPAAPFGGQAVYTLGKAGVPLVARRLDMDLPEATRLARSNYTPTFLEHTLALVDVYLAFRRAVAQWADVQIECWLPEVQCRHEWEIRAAAGGKWKKETFKPDAFVRLQVSGDAEYRNFFLEADLGHTSSRQFLGKLMTHQRYLESGLFEQTYAGRDFKTLVVTTGQRRLRNLRALVEQNNSHLFWFTTFDAIQHASVTGPIWQTPLEDGLMTLV